VTRAERDQLIEENLDQARIIARSVGARLPSHVDLREELLAEAHKLLVEAAESFGAARGLTFKQWYQWIANRRIYDPFRRKNLREAKHVHLEDLKDVAGEDEFADEDHIQELAVPPNQEQAADAGKVRKQVQRLPVEQQQVIALRYRDQETVSRTARRLGMTQAQVCETHREAIQSLRRVLRPAA
jgi:RNA polymerase sigma factor (sigma-70 family)